MLGVNKTNKYKWLMVAQVSKEREMHCKDENLNMPKERKIGSTETSKQKRIPNYGLYTL